MPVEHSATILYGVAASAAAVTLAGWFAVRWLPFESIHTSTAPPHVVILYLIVWGLARIYLLSTNSVMGQTT